MGILYSNSHGIFEFLQLHRKKLWNPRKKRDIFRRIQTQEGVQLAIIHNTFQVILDRHDLPISLAELIMDRGLHFNIFSNALLIVPVHQVILRHAHDVVFDDCEG